jgi:[glutamine synthetase] adenylyltransferase / [glutamine synthetase]-adenylyl-L-tyrosine phosphorylase
VPSLRQEPWPELAGCADSARADLGLSRLAQAMPEAMERLHSSGRLMQAVVDVMAASPFLTRTCVTDPMALDVLSRLDQPVAPLLPLSRWKALEVLRIAALDLPGEISLETVGRSLAELADGLLQSAATQGGVGDELAVIAMGKLGARELNYGSDIDIVLVGDGDPRRLLALVRQAWRTDLALRPEGRSGPLVRSLASYEAYWDRWAETWEFQALLKARPAAGGPELARAFTRAASARVWGRPLGVDNLRSLRAMKAKAERMVASQGLSQREIKLGRGGIRDIEFAVQLLQLVHGREDEALRVPATLDALGALAAGGYVAPGDADALAGAYRFLRAVEHRLQLFEDRQVHALPSSVAARAHLARVLGYRDGPSSTALARFEADLSRHRRTARSIHERLFFRPLLEVFTSQPRRRPAPRARAAGAVSAGAMLAAALPAGGAATISRVGAGALPYGGAAAMRLAGAAALPSGGAAAMLTAGAVSDRLAAFGFSDATRTSDAVVELTQGFSRTSRLMHTMVPLVLDWLSESPDPDLGLLGLRRLATGPHRRSQLSALFRESPQAAQHLCLLLGTGPLFAGDYERHPDQLALLESGPPPLPARPALERRAFDGIAWRPRPEWWRGLANLVRGEFLRAQARDVLGLAEPPETARSLTRLAESVLEASLRSVRATGPAPVEGAPVEGVAIVAMGRFGGAELAYASDLDILVVFDDQKISAEEAEHLTEALLKLVNGETPVQRLYELDLSLRPEGRKGPLARSLKAFESYYARWAQVWERQALTRGRFVAGDADVGARFAALARDFVWGRPLSADDTTEIRRMKARIERERVPGGEDPEFHLKLGPGSLSDVEWTVQLLQLLNGIRAEGTLDALAALVGGGALEPGDAEVLAEAYEFCEATRNRLYVVRGRPGDSLPPPGHQLTALATSVGTSATELREQYRRLTRRARRVTERLFYGSD